MTIERFVQDLNLLAEWVSGTLHQKKILLAAHSWGTVLGAGAAMRRPDLYRGYLGIGQVVNFLAGERETFTWTLDEARRRGHEQAIAELEATMPYPGGEPFDPAKLITQRSWVQQFGGFVAGRDNGDFYTHGETTSTQYQGENAESTSAGNALSTDVVLPQLPTVDFTGLTEFPVPMIQFMGRHDRMTPSVLVPPWVHSLNTPHTALEWFENSAHLPMYEEPGHFLTALLYHHGRLI